MYSTHERLTDATVTVCVDWPGVAARFVAHGEAVGAVIGDPPVVAGVVLEFDRAQPAIASISNATTNPSRLTRPHRRAGPENQGFNTARVRRHD